LASRTCSVRTLAGAVRVRYGGLRTAVPRFLTALACASTLGLSASGAGAATPPAGFFGVGGWSYPTSQQASSLAGAGLRLVRGALGWGDVQTSAGAAYNWSGPDMLAAEAAADHFNIIFDINGCATWACGTTLAPPTGANLPRFESFVRAAAARYAPGSAFWHGRASTPTVTWQVWNEVNGGYFWPNPTPAAYASFFETTAQTIRSADPGAPVIMSGLTGLPGQQGAGGIALRAFLEGLFAQPGFAQATDAIVIHGYAANPAASLALLDTARRAMIAAGDSAQPIWISEMGWASGGPASPFTVSPTQQASYLQQAWSTMLACAPRWNLQHVLWFSLEDVSASVFGTSDYWGFNTGLLAVDGTQKPAYSEFLQFIGSQPVPGTDTCTLPGGLALGGAGGVGGAGGAGGASGAGTSGATGTTSNGGQTGAGRSATRLVILGLRAVTNRRRWNPVRLLDLVNGRVERRARFLCSLDRSRWRRCGSPFNAATPRQGEHWLRVRVAPGTGSSPPPATRSWLVVFTPPRTAITSFTLSPSAGDVRVATFAAADRAGIARYSCRLDGGRWAPCASPFTTPALGQGRHVFAVRAVDRAGNRQRRATVLRFWVG
jgi:hypothetical protein